MGLVLLDQWQYCIRPGVLTLLKSPAISNRCVAEHGSDSCGLTLRATDKAAQPALPRNIPAAPPRARAQRRDQSFGPASLVAFSALRHAAVSNESLVRHVTRACDLALASQAFTLVRCARVWHAYDIRPSASFDSNLAPSATTQRAEDWCRRCPLQYLFALSRICKRLCRACLLQSMQNGRS